MKPNTAQPKALESKPGVVATVAARGLLKTIVPVFLARYPEVQLDLVADGRFVDIVAEGLDAGVRLGEAVPRESPHGLAANYASPPEQAPTSEQPVVRKR